MKVAKQTKENCHKKRLLMEFSFNHVMIAKRQFCFLNLFVFFPWLAGRFHNFELKQNREKTRNGLSIMLYRFQKCIFSMSLQTINLMHYNISALISIYASTSVADPGIFQRGGGPPLSSIFKGDPLLFLPFKGGFHTQNSLF
jgi:hypothetical protein